MGQVEDLTDPFDARYEVTITNYGEYCKTVDAYGEGDDHCTLFSLLFGEESREVFAGILAFYDEGWRDGWELLSYVVKDGEEVFFDDVVRAVEASLAAVKDEGGVDVTIFGWGHVICFG